MNLQLIPTPEFVRSAKKLHKKYRLLSQDLILLEEELTTDPEAGVSLGNHCYKVRLPNSSVPVGKSGGFRVVYFYRDENGKIYLLEIYSKSDVPNISEERLSEILVKNGLE